MPFERKQHIVVNGIELKQCAKCLQYKPLPEFPKDNKWDGLHPYCKACKAQEDKKLYLKDPEKKKKQSEKYVRLHPEKYNTYKPYNPKYYASKISRQKKRARDLKRRMLIHGANGNFQKTGTTIAAVIKKYNGRCAYCGKNCIEDFHIDHKLPLSRSGGNEFGNLALACPHCNLSKHDKTDIEFCGHRV